MTDSPSPRGSAIPCRVFVGGIAYQTTELELKNFFQTIFGHVKDSKIITDREGVSKGYGFITFDIQAAADQALDAKTLYFEEKKLNIGQAIRKPNSGQFSRPSSPDSTGSATPVGQLEASPQNAAAASYVTPNGVSAGALTYAGPQPVPQAAAGLTDPSQYYYSPQSANGVSVEQGLVQPLAVNQQGMYASPSQQAVPMTCMNGWYQPDTRYILQQQKPSQAHGSMQTFHWHTPTQAVTPTATAQWGRAAYVSTPTQPIYTPTQAAAATSGYPTVYYQQPEPQWWDMNPGAAMTQHYMPTDLFLEYGQQPQPIHAQQHQQQQSTQQQVTYQKPPQSYHQHAAFVPQTQTGSAYSSMPPPYSEEHESHPYRVAAPSHRTQQPGHHLPRSTGRSTSSRRETSRRGRRSSSAYRGMRRSPPACHGTSSNDSTYSSAASYDSPSMSMSDCSLSTVSSILSPQSMESPASKSTSLKGDN